MVNCCYMFTPCRPEVAMFLPRTHSHLFVSFLEHDIKPIIDLFKSVDEMQTLTARALDSLVRKSLRTMVTMSW